MKNFCVGCCSLVLIGLTYALPTHAGESPESVVRAYVAAIKERRMAAVAGYIHPDEQLRFKNMLMSVFNNTATPQQSSFLSTIFGKNATPASVQAKTPQEFMRAFMTFTEGQMQSLNVNLKDVKVLGTVKEGEILHLVTRNVAGAGNVQLTQMAVISVKPYQGSWKLLLTGELEAFAQTLKQSTPSK
jgi:hypothetical protein